MADKKPASRLVEQGKKVRFGPDKKPASVYPYRKPFIRTTRVYLLQPYPYRKPFSHQPRLSAP